MCLVIRPPHPRLGRSAPAVLEDTYLGFRICGLPHGHGSPGARRGAGGSGLCGLSGGGEGRGRAGSEGTTEADEAGPQRGPWACPAPQLHAHSRAGHTLVHTCDVPGCLSFGPAHLEAGGVPSARGRAVKCTRPARLGQRGRWRARQSPRLSPLGDAERASPAPLLGVSGRSAARCGPGTGSPPRPVGAAGCRPSSGMERGIPLPGHGLDGQVQQRGRGHGGLVTRHGCTRPPELGTMTRGPRARPSRSARRPGPFVSPTLARAMAAWPSHPTRRPCALP